MEIYRQREWSTFTFAATSIGCAIAIAAIWAKHGNTPQVTAAIVAGVAAIILLSRGSTLVTVTNADLFVQVGHTPLTKRTIPLETIVRVERMRIPWYLAKPVKGWGARVERYCAAPGHAFFVYPFKGKPCIIQSNDTKNVLAALKRARPQIEIIEK